MSHPGKKEKAPNHEKERRRQELRHDRDELPTGAPYMSMILRCGMDLWALGMRRQV
jgi:hypothetical protein